MKNKRAISSIDRGSSESSCSSIYSGVYSSIQGAISSAIHGGSGAASEQIPAELAQGAPATGMSLRPPPPF